MSRSIILDGFGKTKDPETEETILCMFGPAHGKPVIVEKGTKQISMRDETIKPVTLATYDDAAKPVETLTYDRMQFPVRSKQGRIVGFHVFVCQGFDGTDVMKHFCEATALLETVKPIVEYAARNHRPEDWLCSTWDKLCEVAKRVWESKLKN